MPADRPSKSEQRARRIGRLEVERGIAKPWLAVLWLGRDLGHLCAFGRTRAEAIRNVLRAVDRLATRVERSKR